MDKVKMLIMFYNPCLYKGVYYFRDGTGGVRQIERNSYGTKEQRQRKVKPKHSFRLKQALQQHIDGSINFAMRFKGKDLKGNIIAFDLDCKDYPLEVLESVNNFRQLIRAYGIEPFVYHSGGKGYHVEIRTAEPVEQKKLAVISKWLADAAVQHGVRYLDRIYPFHKPAYRIFGSWKLNTGAFTKVLTDSGFIDEPEECWQRFEQHMIDNSIDTDKVTQLFKLAEPPPTLFEKPKERQNKKSSRTTNTKRTSPEGIFLELLLEFYHTGLSTASTRHNTSFHLGRLFRYFHGMSEQEAVEEITSWVEKHFDGTFKPLISSAKDTAISDSIAEVKRAYTEHGWPLQFTVELDKQETNEHIKSKRMKSNLLPIVEYVLENVKTFQSLIFYHSIRQFVEAIGIPERTVQRQLSELQNIGLIRKLKTGNNITHKTTKYRVNLPENCYRVVAVGQAQEELVEALQQAAAVGSNL